MATARFTNEAGSHSSLRRTGAASLDWESPLLCPGIAIGQGGHCGIIDVKWRGSGYDRGWCQ